MPRLRLACVRRAAGTCIDQGDLSSASTCLRAITDLYPRDHGAAVLRGRILLRQGGREQAIFELRQARAADPLAREPWEALAECSDPSAGEMLADLPPLAPAAGGAEISGIALGHLHRLQGWWTHCTAQLGPRWVAGSRPDVGVALAEAHWRLGEVTPAQAICREVLASTPDCLPANLILAQILWAAPEHRAEAEPYLSACRALDPEHDVAERLYAWLAVRQPDLVPLRHEDVEVDVPLDLSTAIAQDSQAMALTRALSVPLPDVPVAGGLGLIEPLAMPLVVAAEAPSPEQAAFEETAPEPAAFEDTAPEPAAFEEAAPEPAVAVAAQVELERAAGTVTILRLSAAGDLQPTDGIDGASRAVRHWQAAIGLLRDAWQLGSVRASTIESTAGVAHMRHQGDATQVALAGQAANLGLLRAALRRRGLTSEETSWNEH